MPIHSYANLYGTTHSCARFALVRCSIPGQFILTCALFNLYDALYIFYNGKTSCFYLVIPVFPMDIITCPGEPSPFHDIILLTFRTDQLVTAYHIFNYLFVPPPCLSNK